MRYITFDDLPEIPADVAVCPICGARIEIVDVDAWETETMRVVDIHINCTTQPDIDSAEWWPWHKQHWSMPYVYWLPVEARVYRWFDSRFRLTPHQPDAAITPAGGGSEPAAAQVMFNG